MGGLISGFTDELHDKLEERHAKDDALKKEKRESFLKGAMNPDASDEMRQYNWDEYSKLAGPGSKPGIKKMGDFVGKIFKHGKAQAQQDPQVSGGAAPQQGPTPAPTSGQGPAQATTQGSPQTTQAPQADAKKRFYGGPQLPTPEQIDARKNAAVKYKSDLDRDAKIAEEKAKPQKLTPVMVQLKGNDKPVQALRNGEGQYFDVNSGDKLEDIDKEMPKESAKGGYIRSVPHSVGLKDARKQAENGAEFPGADGKMIDLESLPEDMGLQAMVRGNEMFWVPVTPTQKSITVGGKVYGVNPYQVQDIGKQGGAAVDLGPSKTGSSSTHEAIAVTPDGKIVKNTLRSTTTPQTPGARQGATPAPAPAGSNAPSPQGGGSTPQAQPPTPAPASRGSDVQGMPSGMYNQMLQRVTPVREAATQVFGDPSQPDVKGLKDYMQLADDPKARERIGTALRLTFDGLNQATATGAHISADAGPVSVSTGGIGQLFTNWLGVPTATAQQQTKIIQDAINKMNPEEKEYYDSVMSAFSTVVGLRSLTRASAAQSSVAAIERELPIIGVNTTDSKQFADQMQRLAEVVYNGTKGIPSGMLDPKLVDRIKNLPSEMQKVKGKTPTKAPASAGPKTAEDYLKSIGVK